MRLAGITLFGKHAGPPRRRLRSCRQLRIADEDQPALVVERLREVALPLERRRHAPLIQAARIGPRQQVLRPEEEQLVAPLVEVAPRESAPDRRASRPCCRTYRAAAGTGPSVPGRTARWRWYSFPFQRIVALVVRARCRGSPSSRCAVTTVIVAPELRPYSAWKFDVCTRISAIESSARRRVVRRCSGPVSLLVTPS